MSEGPKVKGHLIITVAEASGKNKDDQLVWDPNFVEGFVKGASKTPSGKASTSTSYRAPSLTSLIGVQLRSEGRRA